MNITLITIGKLKSGPLATAIDDYLKRLKRYVPYTITELPDAKNAGRISKEEQKEAEGRAILGALSPSDHVMLLDERGRQYTSIEFATKLENVLASGKKRLAMVVGGPYGFSRAVYDRSDELLSLSKMTFSHEMVRLFITEQVYRSMTILRGEPYHHE